MKRIAWTLGLAAAAGTAITLSAIRSVSAEKDVKLSDVPEAVRQTIEAQAAGAEIREVVLDTEDGQTRYEAEILRNGEEIDILVSLTGEYLGIEGDDHEGEAEDDGDDDDDDEESLTWESLPVVVQDAFTVAAPGVTIREIESETEDGNLYYELGYDANGAEMSVKVTADGHVVETESGIATADLPAEAAAAIAAAYPGATIEEAEAVTLNFYEVGIEVDGTEHEVKLLANGHILDDNEED